VIVQAAAETAVPANTAVFVTAVPTVAVEVAEPRVMVKSCETVAAVALAATTDNMPKPRDATATSAMRLKVVFVDICFLSISQDQEFPALGLSKRGDLSYVMRRPILPVLMNRTC
jgi:hypothetical protein